MARVCLMFYIRCRQATSELAWVEVLEDIGSSTEHLPSYHDFRGTQAEPRITHQEGLHAHNAGDLLIPLSLFCIDAHSRQRPLLDHYIVPTADAALQGH
eukprot:1161789-Pelagomonas_calceolata.AAC.4